MSRRNSTALHVQGCWLTKGVQLYTNDQKIVKSALEKRGPLGESDALPFVPPHKLGALPLWSWQNHPKRASADGNTFERLQC